MVAGRALLTSTILSAYALASVLGTPTAMATPGPTNGDDGSELAALACAFRLTPPTLTTLSGGGKAVTAALAPESCTPKSVPFTSTVCVATSDGSNFCKTANAWDTAEVYATSGHYAGTFTASANGCSRVSVGNHTQLVCIPLTPVKLSL